jgi:hypothetical protein
MRLLLNAARWELIILITSFGVITLFRLFKSVSLAGLLRSSEGTVSPGRIQLLVITVLTALQYLLTTIHNPSHLPSIPSNLITVLGGSQLVYLSSKAWDILGPKRNNLEEQ